jgi:hypothetical protein
MRTKPLTRFAAPFVAVVALGGCELPPIATNPPEPVDASVFYDSVNPPPPTVGTECVPQNPMEPEASLCQEDVCAVDPTCCA